MNGQKRHDTAEPDQPRGEYRDCDIGRHGRNPGRHAGAHQPEGKALLQEEEPCRPDAEHHDGVAVEPVAKLSPAGKRLVFGDGKRRDVAHAALVEIACACMMRSMRAAPVIVGGQRQDAEDAADPVVGMTIGEEGAVPAIVLDHEQADEKACSRDNQNQSPPVAIGDGREGQDPECHEGDDGDRKLEDTS